jgi:hypothetical protein
MLFVSASFSAGFGASIDNGNYHAIYHNAMILAWQQQGGGVAQLAWEVKDHSAMREFDKVSGINGFSYNNEFGAYRLTETVDHLPANRPSIDTDTTQGAPAGRYRVRPAMPNFSQIELIANNAASISQFEFVAGASTYTAFNRDRLDSFRIVLPFQFGSLATGSSFTVQLTAVGGAQLSVDWQYTEYVYDTVPLSNYDTWAHLQAHFYPQGASSPRAGARLRGGIVYRIL